VPPNDVRSRILNAATRLFAERGFGSTAIQAVADRVGVTKPTLIYHFGSKDDLRKAVLDGLFTHWRNELPLLMTAAASGGPRIEALLRALFQFFLDDRLRAQLVMREMIDAPDEMRTALRAQMQPLMSLITQAIRDGQAAGTLRRDVDPEAWVLVVVTAAIGVLAAGDRTNALLAPEPTIEAQLDELIRTARTSLLVPRPSDTHPE
jgi:TetR/AcrR family transcriptional regulator